MTLSAGRRAAALSYAQLGRQPLNPIRGEVRTTPGSGGAPDHELGRSRSVRTHHRRHSKGAHAAARTVTFNPRTCRRR